MKNRRSLYLVLPAAALVAFAAPSIAGAQEPTPTPTPTEPAPMPAPTEPSTPAMPAPQDTTPTDVAPPAEAVQDTVSFGTLISALNNVESETQELQALSEVKPENVTVVNVADVAPEGAASAALDAAMQKAEPGVAKLRESLSANTVVNGVLQSGSVQADNVVAADVGANGQVTVFVKPQQ
jgi:hypothetical protein